MADAYELLIRGFTADDADVTAALIRRTLLASNAGDYPTDALERLAEWNSAAGLISRIGHARRLVAVVSGGDLDAPALIGTAARHENKIETVFVDPDWQGSGLGAQLVGRLEDDAAVDSLHALFLESSLTAVGFYEALGYVRSGPAFDLGDGPVVPMRKVLDPPADQA